MDTNLDKSQIILSTIGYEGRTPEEFINVLTAQGVESVVDVRQRAGSRKRGFGKTALAKLLANADITYTHLPELGVPQELRQRLRDGEMTRSAYLARYKREVKKREASLAELEQLIADRHCCLLCLEADHHDCHRSGLANLIAVRSMQPIVVRHL